MALAEKHDGIIINADSMQVYDDLPLLTAQPPPEDKALAPHEFYGYLHPNEDCSAGNWKETVAPRIQDILDQGKSPIVVGGSGLYINALVYGLSPIPDIPDEVRSRASAKQKEMGNPAFHAELKKRDPVMAERLDEYNTARLVRAWEVFEFSGRSLAEWQSLPLAGPPKDWEFDITLVMPEREVLYDRCNKRLNWMMENGALEEVEMFNKRIETGDVKPKALLCHALGFRPLTAYLNGDISKEDAIDQTQRATRKYAKRQTTWFRNQIEANNII